MAEHEHKVNWIRFDGVTEWEHCCCGMVRAGPEGAWELPRDLTATHRSRKL